MHYGNASVLVGSLGSADLGAGLWMNTVTSMVGSEVGMNCLSWMICWACFPSVALLLKDQEEKVQQNVLNCSR